MRPDVNVPERQATPDDVHKYVEQVLDGTITAGRLVHLACERHCRDLEQGEYSFDHDAVDHLFKFFSELRYVEGAVSGLPIFLKSWQAFLLGSFFGWKRKDGLRRYRKLYCEIGRKNEKSTLLAGVGLYGLCCDGEDGAQIYSVAPKKEQAKIIWGMAYRMRQKSPGMSRHVGATPSIFRLFHEESGSRFEPLSRDVNQDGFGPHFALVDEMHRFTDRELLDTVEEGNLARPQPGTFIITTAGKGRITAGWQERQYARMALERGAGNTDVGFVDDELLVYIASIDRKYDGAEVDDDWEDPSCWIKANPNWGYSVRPDSFESRINMAKHKPSAKRQVLQKYLDVWSDARESWLPGWSDCARAFDLESLLGRPCYFGIDMASKIDISALVAFFPPYEGQRAAVVPWFFVPEDCVEHRTKADKVPYRQWVEEGYLIATDGAQFDGDYMVAKVNELFKLGLKAKEIAIDPDWNAGQLAIDLASGEGYNVVEVRCGYAHVSAPCRELEAMVAAKTIEHPCHPVLSWMAGNAMVDENPEGKIRIVKKKSAEKVDGMVALVLAMSRWLTAEPEGSEYSPYENMDILFV